MTREVLLECHERITPYIHNTPVLTSHLFNEIAQANLFFKCENFQKMGAFKIRGATNAILNLNGSQRKLGVVTHSSGNFAQALALAGRSLKVKAYIVMPLNAPEVKIAAVKGYGGIVSFCESTINAREIAANEIVEKTGATFIHPSNDMDVIIGNSTIAMELFEDHLDLDYVVAPVGGGGLIAGTALASLFFGYGCKVIGAEPKAVDDAYRSILSGKIERNETTVTIADGLRTHLGELNFPIIKNYVDQIVCVKEHEIIDAMRLIYERLKIVIEPSSAVAVAAVLKERNLFKDKRVGIILSGGNVDLNQLPFAANQ